MNVTGISGVRGRRVNRFLFWVTLNMVLLSFYIYGKRRVVWRAEERGEELGACFESKKNMGTLEMMDNNICSGRRFREAEENGHKLQKLHLPKDSIINLDHGDPTMFESFWRRVGDKCSILIPGWQTMSYFSDVRNVCWFLEPEFADEVRKMHQLVGNAIADDCYIVVGTGSTQLFQAVLYALSPSDAPEPMNVVSTVPYYSSFQSVTDYLKSGLYKWAGDAFTYDSDAPYIELVTSPNNPDGYFKEPVVNRAGGKLVYDLAYYWPMYTPITTPADHDIMLFTVSKCTGHAGTRIGWALVKDLDVARRMTKFIELNTIGVSKDSQLRAAKVLRAVRDAYDGEGSGTGERFFEFGRRLMAERWERLSDAVQKGTLFSLPDYSTSFCNFIKETDTAHPPFAWLKCEKEADCESFLKRHKILVRSGKYFGAGPEYVRISMLDRDETFDLLIERLLEMQ